MLNHTNLHQLYAISTPWQIVLDLAFNLLADGVFKTEMSEVLVMAHSGHF